MWWHTRRKPDFVFRRKGRVHLNQRRRQFSRLLASRGVRISGINDGYTMFRGSVKGTGYPQHSPVSHSLPLPCVTVCHHISAGVYQVYRCQSTSYFDLPVAQLRYAPNNRYIDVLNKYICFLLQVELSVGIIIRLTLWRRNYFFLFQHTLYIKCE